MNNNRFWAILTFVVSLLFALVCFLASVLFGDFAFSVFCVGFVFVSIGAYRLIPVKLKKPKESAFSSIDTETEKQVQRYLRSKWQ